MTEPKTESNESDLSRRAGESAAVADPARSMPSRSTTDTETNRRFAIEAARTLSDNRCEDVIVLDVRGLSQVTDFIVIGSGTSDRQMRSTLVEVGEVGEPMGFQAYASNEDARAVWLVADFVDVVVHLFEPNTRAHYDLEMLWGDAEQVAWARDGSGGEDRNLAGLSPADRKALREQNDKEDQG